MSQLIPVRLICTACEHLWSSSVPPGTTKVCEECPECGRPSGVLITTRRRRKEPP